MLYPQNNQKNLSNSLFQSPTAEYRGTPFWAWNCELNADELVWQIDQMKEMGLGLSYALPLWYVYTVSDR